MKIHNKRIIVTGGAGVIGKELIRRLLDKGACIRCFDIVPKPKWMSKGIEYSEGDLSQLHSKEFTTFTPEIIFHLAAVFERTDEPLKFWAPNFSSNVQATHKVIDAAIRCKRLQKFLFASSYLVYSPELYLYKRPPAKLRALKEADPINPRNLCGAAKYYSEKELEFLGSFNRYGFISISARIYRVYGLGSRDIISRWVRAALRKEKIEVYGKENSFDYIFADDVAQGLLRLSESDNAQGAVNLGTGKSRKIGELLKIIQKELPDIKIEEIGIKYPFEASSADISLLKKLIRWQPQIKLEEGIGRIIDFERGYR